MLHRQIDTESLALLSPLPMYPSLNKPR
uniref:Uncharacterized protein n=1 Tax=Anguilla anguilla TaxID=7936 RepID=A0A0E9U2S1_ANGAN